MEHFILTVSCADKTGIVAAISGFLAQNGGFILESQQFGDMTTGNFFMRISYTSGQSPLPCEEWKNRFQPIADKFSMNWELQPSSYRMKVLIMVSKEGHCLNTLLNKMSMGTLLIDIPAIISNHAELKKMPEFYDIPFHHFPVTPETKEMQENQIINLIEQLNIDLIILARYMQILSPNFVNRYQGKIINIHHSFLPSFKGAHPYQQAFDRGIKLIGATAHYVSIDLDEGPIIEQEVTRVNHTASPSELISLGQDIEAITLARSVKWHVQKRVFLNGHKTVVFS